MSRIIFFKLSGYRHIKLRNESYHFFKLSGYRHIKLQNESYHIFKPSGSAEPRVCLGIPFTYVTVNLD